MMLPEFYSPTVQPHYRAAKNPNCELPPLQSATSCTIPAPPSRPESGMQNAHLSQPLPHHSSVAPVTSPYQRLHDSVLWSPDEGGPISAVPSSGPAPSKLYQTNPVGHRQPITTQLQRKRAHRQRRKDPSCDACRERKVKCDASGSSSCTECNNRRVHCQFTKETNRRMSSIKQVQDLEEQLQNYNQQLQQLQTRRTRPDCKTKVDGGVSQTIIKFPETEDRPMRRSNTPVSQGFSDVRSNLRYYGRGISCVPTPYRARAAESLVMGDAVDLPQKYLADRLLVQYFNCIHSVLPALHWPIFISEYEKVYRSGSLLGVSFEWAAVLFGVFACGAIHMMEPNSEEEGKKYIRTSCGILDVWHDDFNLDRVRAALLASIFLYEVNSKSASWVWIGSAVRMAQEIGLQLDSGPWPAVEGEMRKRLWWGLYAWDGLLALEMGKPTLINDQDCDVDLPCLVAEQYITERGKIPDSHQTTSLLATIHVVRAISQRTRTRTLRPAAISPAAFESFELHFNTCLATITAQFHPENDKEADFRFLTPVIYLQNARLLLHRQSISPHCPGTVRSSAIDYCISTALDTAKTLARCMRNYPTYPGSGNDLRFLLAGSVLCTHIWRCTLFLLFRAEYAGALACVQALALIGDVRAVKAACGRYLAFFLRTLLSQIRAKGHVPDLDRDEEMIAYISGDIQGTSDSSWVWHGSETGSQLEGIGYAGQTTPKCAGRPEIETDVEWEGWEWIKSTVQGLHNEQNRQTNCAQPNILMARPKQDVSSPPTSQAASDTDRHTSSAPSCMSIANII